MLKELSLHCAKGVQTYLEWSEPIPEEGIDTLKIVMDHDSEENSNFFIQARYIHDEVDENGESFTVTPNEYGKAVLVKGGELSKELVPSGKPVDGGYIQFRLRSDGDVVTTITEVAVATNKEELKELLETI